MYRSSTASIKLRQRPPRIAARVTPCAQHLPSTAYVSADFAHRRAGLYKHCLLGLRSVLTELPTASLCSRPTAQAAKQETPS